MNEDSPSYFLHQFTGVRCIKLDAEVESKWFRGCNYHKIKITFNILGYVDEVPTYIEIEYIEMRESRRK
jgi:hypothetical protein